MNLEFVPETGSFDGRRGAMPSGAYGNKTRLAELVILFLFVVLYVFDISRYFWTLPAPSDPLQYLGPAVWKTTWGYWPWLDRIVLAVNLRLFTMFCSPGYVAAMVYVGLVNTAILVLAMAWAYRKSGFLAALFVAVFINTSFLTLGVSTYLYPDQTVALYSLLAFICFSEAAEGKRSTALVLLAGFFSAVASLSKITGSVMVVCLSACLIYRKQWRGLVMFAIGVLTGCVLSIAAFCLLYNVESFSNVVSQFVNTGISANLNLSYKNAFSYYDTLLSMNYFPLIALCVALGAYSNNKTRLLFVLAWGYVAFIYLVRTVGSSGGPPIPTYLYSAFVFVCLGLAMHMGDVADRASCCIGQTVNPVVSREPRMLLILSGVVFLLVNLGLHLGFQFPAVDGYEHAFNYMKIPDVYTVSYKIDGPHAVWIRLVFSLGPILALVLLLLSELRRQRQVILVFLVWVSFWMAFFCGGLAYCAAAFAREEAGYCYRVAPVLNQIPADRFSFFTKGLTARGFDNVMGVYSLFFDHKYPRGTSYNSRYENEKLVRTNITYVAQENELPEVKGTHIVTDSPEIVLRYYPKARLVGTIKWNKAALSVIDIRALTDDVKDPVPEP